MGEELHYANILWNNVVVSNEKNPYVAYYVDTMNRDATDAFLKCTHEKYAAMCGDRLGKSIKGIFTAEPHRGALRCVNALH